MIWDKDKAGFRMGNFGFETIRVNYPAKNTKIRFLKNRNKERSTFYFQKSIRKSIDFHPSELKKIVPAASPLRGFPEISIPGLFQIAKPISVHHLLNILFGVASRLK